MTALTLSSVASAQGGTYFRFPNSTGCPGSSGMTPDIVSTAPPIRGATFAVNIVNLPPNPADAAFMMTMIVPPPVMVPVPIPLASVGMPGCALGVSPDEVTPLQKRGTTASWSVPISNDPVLMGVSFFNQIIAFDRPFPPGAAPNTLGAITSDTFIGTIAGGPTIRSIREDFTSATFFDAAVSSAQWGGSQLSRGLVGGDGIHGAFDITQLPTNAFGERVWDTSQPLTVPAGSSLLGAQLSIISGRANFSSFEVPAGDVLKFVGPVAPVLRVSGAVVIDGRVSVDGEPAHQPANNSVGAVGGAGGAGGGDGGDGADEFIADPLNAQNPVRPTAANVGRPGDDLRVAVGSGYASRVGGTGGEGAPIFPASGLWTDLLENVNLFHSGQQIAGGGGGGYAAAGGDGAITALAATPPTVSMSTPRGGVALLPRSRPGGVSAYDHFLVGGSGGGGGGCSCIFARRNVSHTPTLRRFTNGHGGGGGGGALALEAGGDFLVGAAAAITARGGSSPDDLGNSWTWRGTSVAGGGSGGTIFLRIGGTLTQLGTVDVQGGSGGRYSATEPGGRRAESVGGDGASGRVIAESNIPMQSLGRVNGSQTPSNTASLSEVSVRTMARSRWYPLVTSGMRAPIVQGYAVMATIDGANVTFAQGSAGNNPANMAGAPIQLFVQTSEIDPATNEPGPSSMQSAWEVSVNQLPSLGNGPQAVRFLIFFDTTTASTIDISDLRIDYRS